MSDDVELMLRVRNGDESAFTELMKRHYRALINYTYRYTSSREAAEDLAQETFLRVYRAAGRYKPEAKFTTWLYRIATNLCLNEVKKKKGFQNVSLEDFDDNVSEIGDSKPGAHSAVFRREIKQAIWGALDSLSQNERVAIILSKYEELPYEEIAEIIGCSLGAVKTYVHRGKKKLVEELKPFLRGDKDEM